MSTCKAIGTIFKTQCGIHPLAGTELCWMHTPGYKPPLQKCREENEKLKKFARYVIEDECWDMGGRQSRDGGDVQDIAEKLGLIKDHPATQEEADGSKGSHDKGDPYYVFTEVLKEE